MKSLGRIFSMVAVLTLATSAVSAQFFPYMQNYRASDQSGINVFETPKDTMTYDGMKLRLGGGFTQQWQSLTHENTADPVYKPFNGGRDSINVNGLYGIESGFNNASANLLIDVQLEDGVRLNLTTYLSARHHNETWVKGGYIQFDRLRFLHSSLIDDIMDYITIRVGHMEINYGDSHFRRSDGGMAIYNPFIENYIVDAFTTEIGGDITFQSNGVLAMVGLTNGEIKGSINPVSPGSGDTTTNKNPSILFKLGYDKQLSDDFRFRITGSGYINDASGSNTLFWGDRTGSNYYLVMESQAANYSSTAANAGAMKPATTSQAWSGRINPGFTRSIQAFMINAFVKYNFLELFVDYDFAKGKSASEVNERNMNQIAADLIARIGSHDEGYVGVRYNMASIETAGIVDATGAQLKQNIDRLAVAAGWFMTKNILLKGEYVTQTYKDYPSNNLFNGGKFSGVVMEAVIGF